MESTWCMKVEKHWLDYLALSCNDVSAWWTSTVVARECCLGPRRAQQTVVPTVAFPKKALAQWLQQFASSTEVSTLLQMQLLPSRRNFYSLPSLVSPSWDHLALLSVAPFVGMDDALSPLQWMSMHLHCCRTTQGNLADVFLLLSQVFSTLREPTSLCLQMKCPFNTISDLEVTDQSALSGCLVGSGH